VKPRTHDAGFTLIEVMISLGLFGLIAIAGLALVTGIINVQGRTDARLERLGQVQRTMFVVSSDIDQIAAGRVTGGQGELTFTRTAPGAGGPPMSVHYSAVTDALVREIGPVPQPLLPGVTSARWRFWDGKGWVDLWPQDPTNPDLWPHAIELQMQVASPGGPSGSLRRVIPLPAQDPVPTPVPVEAPQ
jgi:general secretion pathway protein J